MKRLSRTGNGIIGSEIIKISQQIKEIAQKKPVANLTIGDFDSKKWPIPDKLKTNIQEAYDDNLTNYPTSQGELSLRMAVSGYLKDRHHVDYSPEEILIGAGVRPLIYTIFKGTVNPGDGVIYPVPSWNNNHYSFLHDAVKQEIECKPENSFFPSVMDVDVKINRTTSLVCICSPQNPTGRVISPEVLKGICDLIVNENNVRKDHINSRPLYLFFDQIYSDLTQDDLFVHPLTLCPEIKDYLICVDGISKSLNATGVRVGWAFGPKDIIGKLTEIFSHIGAWAPKAEQNAVQRYMTEDVADYLMYTLQVTNRYGEITKSICDMFDEMKGKGFRVDCQRPEGGIYISIFLDYTNAFGKTEDYVSYLINNCGLGVVPFEYFGSKQNKGWFRISVGNIDESNVDDVVEIIKNAIIKSHVYYNSMV